MLKFLSLSRYASMINKLSSHYMVNKLKEYKINYTQFIILMILYNNEANTQEELRQIIFVDKAAIARAIKDLENKGYIKRILYMEDKRSKKILITRKGNEIKNVVISSAIEWDNYLIKNLSENEKNKLNSQLEEAFMEGKKLFESIK